MIRFFLEKWKITFAKATNKLPTMSSSSSFPIPDKWMSLYIPVVPSDLSIGGLLMNNEMAFQYYFENMLPMGKVSRVDFITRVGEHSVTSAFVHFSAWFESSYVSQDMRSKLETDGTVRMDGGVGPAGYAGFVSSSDPEKARFINIKINKAPIQRVVEIPKNIHQIINNYGLMEGVISEQHERLVELGSLVDRLRQTILDMESSEGPAPAIIDSEDGGPMELSELA